MSAKCTPFKAACAMTALIAVLFVPALKSEAATQTVIYKTIDGKELDLDADIPPGSDPVPVILYVHSWSGNKNQLKSYASRLEKEGVAAVRINYRKLSDGHSFGQAIADVRDALQWLRDHADSYRFDTRRIGLAGASAGGFLASLVALENPDCRILIGFNGGYDLVERDGSDWPPDVRMKTLLGEENTEEARLRWSAIHKIPAAPLPAVLLLHGTEDATITFRVAQRFQQALELRGAPAELVAFEGAGHGFFSAPQYFDKAYSAVAAHVSRYLLNAAHHDTSSGPP